jgi:hypothetical protein
METQVDPALITLDRLHFSVSMDRMDSCYGNGGCILYVGRDLLV